MTRIFGPPPSPPPIQRKAGLEPPIPSHGLIFDDGEPLETYHHRTAMGLLIESAEWALLAAGRDDFDVGGNMFVYYSAEQRMNKDFRGPDVFIVLGVEGKRERKGWVLWEEDWKFPDVIVELLSPSTIKVDRVIKKDLYEQGFKTQNYFIYDPENPEVFEGWCLDARGTCQSLLPNGKGQL
jgi:Uma2 family endonuclease